MNKTKKYNTKNKKQNTKTLKHKYLYHGSPYKLKLLKPHTPHGNNNFNTQTGVYLTSNKIEAQLYSLARDTERNNKSWGIYNGKLFLAKENWDSKHWNNTPMNKRFKLNNEGYLYIINKNNYNSYKNPYYRYEYIILNTDVKPYKIVKVKLNKSLEKNIIYVDKIDLKTLPLNLLYQKYINN